MRTIKFRMWDRVLKCYLTLYGKTFIYNPLNGTHIVLFVEHIKNLSMLKSLVLEQYTGLKDKNGKEIYEGDIIKYQDRDYGDVFGQGDVYYDGDDCMFKIRCRGFVLFFMNLSNDELEVVGNIHDKEKPL